LRRFREYLTHFLIRSLGLSTTPRLPTDSCCQLALMHFLPLLLLAFSGSLLPSAHSLTEEEDALCSFISSTNIQSISSSWNCDTNLANKCSWTGITCDGNQNPAVVVSLSLGSQGLSGTIPSQISGLADLSSLNLNTNQLYGTLPHQIGSLTNLTSLQLSQNSFLGPIPSSLGSLGRLSSLSLLSNSLTGSIPATFQSLTKITYLTLGANTLVGPIPSFFGSLTKLSALVLSTNRLTSTIPDLSALTALTALELGANSLTGSSPSYLGNFTKLSSLGLCCNRLVGTLPRHFPSQLTFLRLAINSFTGSVPSEIGSTGFLIFAPEFVHWISSFECRIFERPELPWCGFPTPGLDLGPDSSQLSIRRKGCLLRICPFLFRIAHFSHWFISLFQLFYWCLP
jgi:hypothetical protein